MEKEARHTVILAMNGTMKLVSVTDEELKELLKQIAYINEKKGRRAKRIFGFDDKDNFVEVKRKNICSNVNCHEKCLTYQEQESGFCQKHGGLLDDIR